MVKRLFYDTCSLLNLKNISFEEPFIISSISLLELENIKSSGTKDESTRYKAREVIRKLNANKERYKVVIVDNDIEKLVTEFNLPLTNDNKIIACAYKYSKEFEDIVLYSDDICCTLIAKNIFGLEVKSTSDDIVAEEYTGFKEVILSDIEMAYFYEHLSENIYNLFENQYIIIRSSNGDIIDKYRWSNSIHRKLKYSQVDTSYTDKIKPKNYLQECAFDMLQDDSIRIKTLSGCMGSGKTLLMVSNAIKLVKSGKYDKILWLRNNIEVNGTKPIGFLPSSKEDKLRHLVMSVADHCGGEEGLDRLLRERILEVEHIGFIRGRSLNRTLVICNECENLTVDIAQLLITRIAEDSQIWFDGDLAQIDSNVFQQNNGLQRIIERLQNNKLFGYVKLQQCERSEMAKLANLLNIERLI